MFYFLKPPRLISTNDYSLHYIVLARLRDLYTDSRHAIEALLVANTVGIFLELRIRTTTLSFILLSDISE